MNRIAAPISAERLRLASEYELQIVHDRCYIVRRTDHRRLAALDAASAVAVGLLDGRRTVTEVGRMLRDAMGERTTGGFDQLLDRLSPLLRAGSPRSAEYTLQALAAVRPVDPSEGIRPLPGPRVLHWHVTRYCPRRCVYCYAEPVHGSSAPDAEITRERLARVFSEAAALGARDLLVSGAEPFLRPDLCEVLGDAVAVGIDVHMTTKFPIDLGLARRLSAAGVRHLCLSVDSFDSRENAALIGSASYGEHVRRTVHHLRSVRIDFSLQAVITRLNANALPELAGFAAEQGARALQVVPYRDVARPIGVLNNEALRLDSGQQIDAVIDAVRARHPGLDVRLFEEASSSGGFHCDIGQTKLFFLPDGVVHRCYKLTDDAELEGLDLRRVDLAAAWHDPKMFAALVPTPHSYQGSACSGCGNKSTCDTSGRCIYEAKVRHGRYAAPDRGCSRASVERPIALLRRSAAS